MTRLLKFLLGPRPEAETEAEKRQKAAQQRLVENMHHNLAELANGPKRDRRGRYAA